MMGFVCKHFGIPLHKLGNYTKTQLKYLVYYALEEKEIMERKSRR